MIILTSEKKLPAQQPEGKHQNGTNKPENGFDRKSDDSEWQQDKPDQRKKDNKQECKWPAERQQQEPQEYNEQDSHTAAKSKTRPLVLLMTFA